MVCIIAEHKIHAPTTPKCQGDPLREQWGFLKEVIKKDGKEKDKKIKTDTFK